MQRNRIKVESVRPSERSKLYEYASEERMVFQRSNLTESESRT
jgi:hypothetical protein